MNRVVLEGDYADDGPHAGDNGGHQGAPGEVVAEILIARRS